MTKADDSLQKHIDLVTGFITIMQSRRIDLMKKMYEMQKQDTEFEKLLQVALLRLLAAHDIPPATVEKIKFKDSNAYQ